MKLVNIGDWRLDLGITDNSAWIVNRSAPFIYFDKQGNLKGATRWQEIVAEVIEWMKSPDVNVL